MAKESSPFLGLLYSLQEKEFEPKTLVGMAEYLLRDDLITFDEFREYFAQFAGKQDTPKPDRQDIPKTKMRRFLAVDKRSGEKTEGILWSSGDVTLDPGKKQKRDFTGIEYYLYDPQWIDEAENDSDA
jgi:hypothetical protein